MCQSPLPMWRWAGWWDQCQSQAFEHIYLLYASAKCYIIFIIIFVFHHAPPSYPLTRSSLNSPFSHYFYSNKLTNQGFLILMKILISGGGIAGLTLGLAAKKLGHVPLIIEQRPAVDVSSFGGGIGLWPPSQRAMELLGILAQLQANGLYMPSACYYDSYGHILAHPSAHFSSKFPVLCLEREQLLRTLYRKCLQEGIQIRTSTKLESAESFGEGVKARLSNGENIRGEMLVGADGIGSKVRSLIMKQNGKDQIIPHHCQYAYFRAVLELKQDLKEEWHKHAFQSWGNRRRFGYVPLKFPKTFWFVAIPIGERGLEKRMGSHLCSESQKQWILEQFEEWKGPISIKKLIQMTPPNTILRTDICKVKDVTSFPWVSKSGSMIILGDAANATAPNLAQGAGLAIESAWDFVASLDCRQDLAGYIAKRKLRASTVQTMADLVARVGQLSQPWSSTRNFIMRHSTNLAKPLQQRVFERIVSHSVGGNSSRLSWVPPNVPFLSQQVNLREAKCMLSQIMGKQDFVKLPQKTKIFRGSMVGSGGGKVSVSSMLVGRILGLPNSMKEAPFGAYCETIFGEDGGQHQIWTRVFGEGTDNATKYSTTHWSTPNLGISKYGLALTETIVANNGLRFGYLPVLEQKTVIYKSKGLWFRDYKLPIPLSLLPVSEWAEKHFQNGWNFRGQIALPPILGSFPIMRYEGTFEPRVCSGEVKKNQKTVVIAGGTGMIGSNVARAFYLAGWNVQILTRNRNKKNLPPYAKIHKWAPSQHIDEQELEKLSKIFERANLVINLSGENPGSGFWTPATKIKILKSRLISIKNISQAFKKIVNKQVPSFLQASAAGIYGDRREEILVDESEPGSKVNFRTTTCKQIEKLTNQLFQQASILRIGHVFSSEGGLLPHLNLASKFRIRQFGTGNQYAPWIHIQDLSNSLVHIGENLEKFGGKTINIASPNHQKYENILEKLCQVRGRKGLIKLPQYLLELVLGEISSVLLESQRMHPKMLLESRFEFKYADLGQALTSRECL